MALSKDVLNILLIGTDSNQNLPSQNTDVIIVVSVNKDTKQVSLLSIPRDLWVYIPDYGWNRINTAHKRGYLMDYPGEGPGLLMRTIEVNLGIPVEHWLRVGYAGFIRVVDELGGVDMIVPCPVNLQYNTFDVNAPPEGERVLEPGVYHMDGATALRYVRTRHGTSDFDRARRQQQFLKAVWDQTKVKFGNMGIGDVIPTIRGLWSALKDSYETNLGIGDVLSLVPVALDIQPHRIRNRYIGPGQTKNWVTSEGAQVLLPDYERIQEVVASLYAPPSAYTDQTANEAARIQVRNGTSRRQLALIAADQLRWQGLTILDTAPADNPNYRQTQIIVYNHKSQALEVLTQALEVKPENIVYYAEGIDLPPPDPEKLPDMLVILGDDYDPCK